MELVKLDNSLFSTKVGYKLPGTARSQMQAFLEIGGESSASFCELEIDKSKFLNTDAGFIVEKAFRFVGSDGIGPLEKALPGRTASETLSYTRSDTMYFVKHTESADCRFIFFDFVPIADQQSEKSFLLYKTGNNEILASLLESSESPQGGFWYGQHIYPAHSISSDMDDQIHISDVLWRTIGQHTFDFLAPGNLSKYKEFRVKPKRGVLLSGSPGTGKTVLSRMVIREALQKGLNVVFLDPQTVKTRHMRFSDLYRFAVRRAPVIILIDDIDLFFSDRDFAEGHNMLGEMLQALDGVHSLDGIVALATTNHFDKLDPALVRPGRFDVHLVIEPLKGAAAIEPLMQKQMPEPIRISGETLSLLEDRTPAELVEYCNRYKLALISDEKDFEWSEQRFRKIIASVQAERSNQDQDCGASDNDGEQRPTLRGV